jgi:Uma2 family endonuclease
VTVFKRDTDYHTYADYLVWSAPYGDELIDGTAYTREPRTPTLVHQEFVVGLCGQIGNALIHKPCQACVSPLDVRLPKASKEDDQIDTVVQPDFLIVCDPEKVDERGVCGAPDWLAEVLSPATACHDQVVKLPAYERAGVREVWLIHPDDQVLTIYRLEGGRYGRPTILELKGQIPLTAVPGVIVDWDEMMARVGELG